MLATCNSIIDPANLQEVNSTIFTFQLSNKRIGWVEDILFVDFKTFHDYQDMYIFTQVRSKTENSGEEKSANALIFNKVGAKTTKNLGFLVQFYFLENLGVRSAMCDTWLPVPISVTTLVSKLDF